MILIFNAKIHTLDEQRPSASAIAIRDGRVTAVGEARDFQAQPGGMQVFDAGGRTIIPGLIDAHIHLENYAFGLQKVDCETDTRQECLERVVQRARATAPGEWILGHGWNQNQWVEGFGTASDLDAVAPDHPVYLTAKSLHAGWANTAALRRAGVSGATADPPGGRVGRDVQGSPDGILFESAMSLVSAAVPEPSVEQAAQAIQAAQARLWQMGLTGAHDFDRRRCFAALQILHAHGDLRLRVTKSIPLDMLEHAAVLGLRTGFGDEWLRIGSVKAFADGALGPQTAAMLQPYEQDPANRGMLLLDAEELFEHGRMAVENGLSLAVHAIGDRANHEVLEAYTQLRGFERQQGLPPLRHRIEHVQLLHPGDTARLAELGIIASMQPIHAPSDMRMADRHWGKRSALAYAWRTQLEHGATLAFGSDAPVESPNPFWGLHAAVTRRRLDGSPGADGWYPEQRLRVEEALRGFTTGAAYAAGMEQQLGRLAPGFLADLLVLDVDPFTCQADELADIHPVATMVGGQWVWGEYKP